jgi:hypothetical protein
MLQPLTIPMAGLVIAVRRMMRNLRELLAVMRSHSVFPDA